MEASKGCPILFKDRPFPFLSGYVRSRSNGWWKSIGAIGLKSVPPTGSGQYVVLGVECDQCRLHFS